MSSRSDITYLKGWRRKSRILATLSSPWTLQSIRVRSIIQSPLASPRSLTPLKPGFGSNRAPEAMRSLQALIFGRFADNRASRSSNAAAGIASASQTVFHGVACCSECSRMRVRACPKDLLAAGEEDRRFRQLRRIALFVE